MIKDRQQIALNYHHWPATFLPWWLQSSCCTSAHWCTPLNWGKLWETEPNNISKVIKGGPAGKGAVQKELFSLKISQMESFFRTAHFSGMVFPNQQCFEKTWNALSGTANSPTNNSSNARAKFSFLLAHQGTSAVTLVIRKMSWNWMWCILYGTY